MSQPVGNGVSADEVVKASKVYRQVVSIEIMWFEDGHFRDWEGVLREAVLTSDWDGYPGASKVSEAQELTP